MRSIKATRWSQSGVMMVALGVAAGTGAIGQLGDAEGAGGENPRGGMDVPASSQYVRLSGPQWVNAARDALLGDTALVDGVRLFASVGTYDTLSESTAVGGAEINDLRTAADTIADRVAYDATRRQKLTGGGAERADVQRAIETFGRRAFRRAITADERDAFLTLVYDTQRQPEVVEPGKDPAQFALRQVISAMLQSPDFVYRSELGVGSGSVLNITGAERAAKLSFALWNTGPSDSLLDAAAKGDLDSADGLGRTVDDMLKGERAKGVLVRFHEMMFETNRIASIQRDTSKFPRAYGNMGSDMAEELRRLASYVAVDDNEGGGWKALLTSRTAFVNKPLAAIYDLPDGTSPDANTWTKVLLPEGKRAGAPSRAGVMALYSNGVQPSSVRRGLLIAQSVACVTIAQPSVQVVPTFDQGSEATNRKRVESKTKGCGTGCHGNGRDEVGPIGPLGFAFENYDAAGSWRDTDGGSAVDSAATLAPFGAFTGAADLLTKLANTDQSHACYAKGWSEYLLGRRGTKTDEPLITRVAGSSRSGATVRQIVKAIVTSDLFLTRKTGA